MYDYINYVSGSKETVATYTYGNSTWGDMLTAYNGTAITYDAISNPLKWRNSSSLTWEGRTLTAQTLNSDDRLTYSYNSNGIRTQKQFYDYMTGGYRTYNYVLDGTRIIKETVSDPAYNLNYTLYYLYDASGSVQGFIYNNQYYYFQKNLQGDVVRILNSSGTVVVEYTYDAWGKVLSVTGSQASTIGQYNPFRYRSYYYDVETGFYYLQSRYYDPTVGRFLNADGIIGANGGIEGYNMFAYCSNNPVKFADYSGYLRTYSVNETGVGCSSCATPGSTNVDAIIPKYVYTDTKSKWLGSYEKEFIKSIAGIYAFVTKITISYVGIDTISLYDKAAEYVYDFAIDKLKSYLFGYIDVGEKINKVCSFAKKATRVNDFFNAMDEYLLGQPWGNYDIYKVSITYLDTSYIYGQNSRTREVTNTYLLWSYIGSVDIAFLSVENVEPWIYERFETKFMPY